MSDYIRQNSVSIDYQLGDSWIILSEIEQSIKQKIESNGTPLRDWNITINRGILTGLNEAFIISKEKRDELIASDPKSAEIIRPILRGRDIERYSYKFSELYVITAYKGIHKIIEANYPAVFAHLSEFESKLKQRGQVDGKPDKPGSNQHHWTELDNNISLEKLDDFSKPKIVWAETMRIRKNKTEKFPRFSYIDDPFFVDKTCFFATGEDLDYCLSILNSSVGRYQFSQIVPMMDNGGYSMQKIFIERFIIALPGSRDGQNLPTLIRKIILSEDVGERAAIEDEIDNLVFAAFHFSDREKQYIIRQNSMVLLDR